MKRPFHPDSRVLLAAVFSITSMAIAFADLAWLTGLLALSIAALKLARVPLGHLRRRMRRFRWFFFLLAVVQSLTSAGGQVLLQWGGVVLLSTGGLIAALSVMLRIMVILAIVLLLTLHNSQQLVVGMVQLRVPYQLAYMVLLAIRFIPVLGEDFRDALVAIQLRGVDIERVPLKRKLSLYTYILMPVVAGALIRARRIATAMDARAFRAHKYRTWLDWPVLDRVDWLLLLLIILGTIAAYALYMGGVKL